MAVENKGKSIKVIDNKKSPGDMQNRYGDEAIANWLAGKTSGKLPRIEKPKINPIKTLLRVLRKEF